MDTRYGRSQWLGPLAPQLSLQNRRESRGLRKFSHHSCVHIKPDSELGSCEKVTGPGTHLALDSVVAHESNNRPELDLGSANQASGSKNSVRIQGLVGDRRGVSFYLFNSA